MQRLYYTPPSDEIFEEVKKASIYIWSDYEDERYVNEKVGRIKDISNISDNMMYMVAMFDIYNQKALSKLLSKEAKIAIRERMIDGGCPSYLIPF